MREQLNSNPMVQMGVIAALIVAAAIFMLTTMGGGGGEESESSALSASSAAAGEGAAPSPGETAVEAAPPEASSAAGAPSTLATRPVPHKVVAAWDSGQTVALVFVHDGGIDDDLVKLASGSLAGMSGVSTFVVPAGQIADYAAITEGIGVERVPALVVLRPKRLSGPVPTASVNYGFQDAESIVQAVVDAGYHGPTVEYHP
ncbi:MAG: hypothetical protein ABW065_06290 [Solirubrobacterales bacterium]